ncbi:protein LEO1 homolog [Phoenix dactylifera]|uniref:Protein LEO1 homolog n=1 Tax=Phoenix dactylifera TaxID=42345 RepID=A0A8B7BWI4_PHODC|nr:protein LEO1 homolog [Phoenix dactylifera]XP_008786814.2 protein LEO1 homolog [Phoenix dactylifera]
MEEETRNQMMQNLFGDQSEEEEEAEEADSEHEVAANHSDYHSDEAEGEAEIDGEGEGEGEGEVEGQGEVDVESEAEAHDIDLDHGESEGERVQSSPEREISDQRMESEPKDADSEEEGYGQRVVTSRRREIVASDSEGSEDNHYADRDNEDMEVDNTRKPRSVDEQKDHEVVRDVFGDSDEEEPAEYSAQNEIEQHLHRSPMEEEGSYEKGFRPEDIVPDDDGQYESEDENLEKKPKEKPVGPPLELDIPLRPPPGHPEGMNMIKVSNIMGIEPKPFDPKTYIEEDVFVTDESGAKKRIRLEDNIVRWRAVKNRDGTTSYESNARFVRWEDGSLQLLIGNEVLDISVHEADHDQTHLFLRHGKGILQSQGRLLRKMRFMPSSLSSKSHRLLTALVDSRHKKVYKVKNCITDIDPEREKEEKERVEGQTIRANVLLQRKREKVNRKYTQTVSRGQQLSPGFLEEALEEEDEPEDYYNSRRAASARNRFEEDMEAEAQAEKRIMNAKRSNILKSVPRKPSLLAARLARRRVEEYSESDREESEYESDGEDIERSLAHTREDEPDHEDEYEEDEADEEALGANSSSNEDEYEEPRKKIRETGGSSLKRKEIESDGESPPRKTTVHRRKAVVFDSDEE